jgi:hypothetical protein
VVRDLAEIFNLRHRITRLKLEGGELAKYGPAKVSDRQGIDTYEEGAATRERGPFYCMDPTGRRTGEGESMLKVSGGLNAAPHACSRLHAWQVWGCLMHVRMRNSVAVASKHLAISPFPASMRPGSRKEAAE